MDLYFLFQLMLPSEPVLPARILPQYSTLETPSTGVVSLLNPMSGGRMMVVWWWVTNPSDVLVVDGLMTHPNKALFLEILTY